MFEIDRVHRGGGWAGSARFLLTPALFVAGAWLAPHAFAASHAETVESVVPRLEAAPEGDPLDRLAESEVAIIASGGTASARAIDAVEAARLVDRNAATAIALAAGEAIEFRFIGAPRWLDRVEVEVGATNAASIAVEVLSEQGWAAYGSASASIGSSTLVVSGAEVCAQGLRLASDAPMSVIELDATFEQVDPDGGATLGSNIYHYDWVNSYPWTNDLSKCDNDARGLRDHLPGSWSYGGHGNSDAHEHHYKRDDLGTGDNTGHLDWSDLSYFSGHGSGTRDDWYYDEELGAFLFGEEVDDTEMVPGDARNAWGNGNCEWHAMSSCRTLNETSWDYWYEAMDGLHMILGASTTVLDKNYGTSFARRMVDSGIFDSAHGVRSSWGYTLDLHNWGGTGVVIAETSDNGGDHLWGQGGVSDDAPNNNYYHWWTYDLGIFARQDQDPLAVALIQDRARYAAPANASLLPRLAPQGFDVAIDPSLLGGAETSQQLPCYSIVPFTVSDTYVRGIANAICQSRGVLCGGTIGSSGDGDRNLIVGPHELRVNEATGNFEYVDVDDWLVWLKTKPQLPTESAAQAMAMQIASTWPGMPQGGVYVGADYAWQGARQATGGATLSGADDPDSTFATSIRLKFERRIGGLKVRGGGGRWNAVFGGNGRLQRVMNTGWHNLATGGMVNILPAQTIVDAIRTQGWNAAIDGMRIPVEQLTITNLEVGYYEPPLFDDGTSVCPCYIVSGVIGTDQTPVEFCCWADATMPQGQILSPPDGSSIAPGTTVCFVGSGSGGVSPLGYRWLDELGNQIGAGANACAPIDYLPFVDEAPTPERTIELVVKDALGRETSRFVHLKLSGSADVTTSAPLARLELAPSAPNPFTSSTTLRYVLTPAAAGERTTLVVHDIAGRAVRTLVDAEQTAGNYTVVWDGADDRGHRVANGTYFYRLSMGGETRAAQVTIVR